MRSAAAAFVSVSYVCVSQSCTSRYTSCNTSELYLYTSELYLYDRTVPAPVRTAELPGDGTYSYGPYTLFTRVSFRSPNKDRYTRSRGRNGSADDVVARRDAAPRPSRVEAEYDTIVFFVSPGRLNHTGSIDAHVPRSVYMVPSPSHR